MSYFARVRSRLLCFQPHGAVRLLTAPMLLLNQPDGNLTLKYWPINYGLWATLGLGAGRPRLRTRRGLIEIVLFGEYVSVSEHWGVPGLRGAGLATIPRARDGAGETMSELAPGRRLVSEYGSDTMLPVSEISGLMLDGRASDGKPVAVRA